MTSPRVWFVVHPQGLVVRRAGERVELPNDEDAATLGLSSTAGEALGTLDSSSSSDRRGRGVSAVAASIGDVKPAPPFEIGRLRDLYVALGDERFMMAGRATQVVEWAETNRFCGRCAARTERVSVERCMRCPVCGLLAYPRIAPAVIVLVRRGDEALLARGSRFPGIFYSTLAGFVEIGESLEDTIVREIREEVGVDVKAPRYFGSQPWPFPHSLMVGFSAEWAGGDIKPDGTEILDARWFRVDDLPAIPPPVSIARRLIDAWIDDVARS